MPRGSISTPRCREFYYNTYRLVGISASTLCIYYLAVGVAAAAGFVLMVQRYLAERVDFLNTIKDLKL